tara:strand:- start:21 stop:965 length:945 start_codon:yes stop_codon:yes gene_type:complete
MNAMINYYSGLSTEPTLADDYKLIMPYTFEDCLNCKNHSKEKLAKNYESLVRFNALTNQNKFCGNDIIYKYQLANMLNCRRGRPDYKTLEEWFSTPEYANELWRQTLQRNRRKKATIPSPTDVYECHRLNNGAIVSFKPATAKYIYKRFNATNVLDPCAGWGGRMLGALSLGISYTGYDTNVKMKLPYSQMRCVASGFTTPVFMNWYSCLDGDFTDKEYDLILTSPPYANVELYEGMTPWKNSDDFYKTFMVPLMDKLFTETNCPICINMSPVMYDAMVKRYGLKECDESIDLRQQLGKKYKTVSQNYIYVWIN